MIALVVLIVCILSSSISSSIWGFEVNKLNTAGRCRHSIVLCPLNENIGDSKYINDLFAWLEKGTLSGRHLFNSHYYDDNSGTGLEYCKEDYSVCRWNGDKVTLNDFLLYRTVFTNNSGKTDAFYIIPFNFITDMGTNSKTIQSLNDFLNTLNRHDKAFALKTECSITTDPSKRQSFFNDCIFFNYPFDSIVSVLKNTVYKDLNPTITSSYLQKIEDKINTEKTLTTFEYFSYFAIQSKNNNKTYKFLTQANM